MVVIYTLRPGPVPGLLHTQVVQAMALKPCLDCGVLSTGPRCPPHTRAASRARGTTAQRGLAGQHAVMSRTYKAIGSACVHCGSTGTPNNPITAGHIVPRVLGGSDHPSNYQPECRKCGSSIGAADQSRTTPGGG